MSLRLIALIIGLILLCCAGCGILTVALGSVTLHTGWFGVFFAALSRWPKE